MQDPRDVLCGLVDIPPAAGTEDDHGHALARPRAEGLDIERLPLAATRANMFARSGEPSERRAMAALAFALVLLPVLPACSAGPAPFPGAPAVAAEEASCGACHPVEGELHGASRLHRAPGVEDCVLCHAPHGPDLEAMPPVPAASCESCHAEVVASFRLPFSHPLGVGIACTSCHPPHGDRPRALREHVRHAACVGCHVEKAGPYLFEHEADRTLLCLACHLPHGSSNRRLLTHASSRSLCMSCHEDLDAIHRQNPIFPFRECLQCHAEVHGSNWSGEFFR